MRPVAITVSGVLLAVSTLALAACDKAPEPPPAASESAANAPPAIPVMGPERPILATLEFISLLLFYFLFSFFLQIFI